MPAWSAYALVILFGALVATPQSISTEKLATTHASLTLLFEYEPGARPCGGTCGTYRMWLTFRGQPQIGAATAADWTPVANSGCMDIHLQTSSSFVCAHSHRIAGRDRSGADYVVLSFRTTRDQLTAIAADEGAKFSIGEVVFRLQGESRMELLSWLERVARRKAPAK